jgi:excisionase family DNA binding protein
MEEMSRIEETLARIDHAVAHLLHLHQEARQEWLSIRQAAAVTGLSDTHVRRAVKKGELPASNAGTTGHPIWRIARLDLAQWMERRKGETAAAVPPKSELSDLIERHLPGLRGRKDSAAR